MFQNKKILVLGLARSGFTCCKQLVKLKCQIVLNDNKQEELLDQKQVQELKQMGIKTIFGNTPDDLLDNTFDYVIKNPGIRNDHKYVLKAKKLKIPVINEVELAYSLLPNDVKLIAITGTNGKTTTTTLTYNLLKRQYPNTHLAGNIGYPLCSILDDINPGDILVMEISCQQLANLDKFHPKIAALTNLSPAHIDFFNDYETYKKVKLKLFQNQTSSDIAILNLENEDSLLTTKMLTSKKMYFSSKQKTDAYLKNDNLYFQDELIINKNEMFIRGNHNVENALIAISIAKLMKVDTNLIKEELQNFHGVSHRLEFVKEIQKRKFYNDTEATNIKCTEIALGAFPNEKIILFLGGLERGQKFEDLEPFLKNVKVIIGIGECRKRVKELGDSLHIKTFIYEHLKDGFKKAYEESNENDIILLSPASASWDQYKECEERGAEFKKLVERLADESN